MLNQYILSVLTSAVICGIISGSAKGTSIEKIIKLVCSIFMTMILLNPIVNFDFPQFLDFERFHWEEAYSAAEAGKTISGQMKDQIIIENTRAYILNKAAGLGITLDTDILLDRELNIPERIILYGNVSQREKKEMQSIIENELAIPKEKQIWTSTGS